MMILNFIRLILVGSLLIPTIASATYITRSEDANGWAEFTPADDSRICYVADDGDDGTAQYYDDDDAAIGSDPFDPDGPISAYATFAAAYADCRDGYPDWILLKRGDTWTANWGTLSKSGRGATEPFLMGSYGSSGVCPIIQCGTDRAWEISTTESYIAFMGIDFYAHSRNPGDGGSLQDGTDGLKIGLGAGETLTGLLIEGCKFRWFEYNQIQCNAPGDIDDIEIRRCIFSDNYAVNTTSQGLYVKWVGELKFEENYFLHNGWYQQSPDPYTGDESNGYATVYNHNFYLVGVQDAIMTKNVVADGSSAGIKTTSPDPYPAQSQTIENNLLIGNEVALGINYNGTYHNWANWRAGTVSIDDNVITNGCRLNPTNRELCWGIWFTAFDSGTMSRNLIINEYGSATNAFGMENSDDPSRNTTIDKNIIFNWGNEEGLSVVAAATGSSGMIFSNNYIQQPDIANDNVLRARYDLTGEWTFSGNTYYADSDTFRTSVGTTDMGGWNTWVSDVTSTWSEYSFSDDTRDIDTYMQSLGETATINEFIVKCRAQDRYSWDIDYEADSVNDWIRAGFGLNNNTSVSIGTTITGGGSGGSRR